MSLSKVPGATEPSLPLIEFGAGHSDVIPDLVRDSIQTKKSAIRHHPLSYGQVQDIVESNYERRHLEAARSIEAIFNHEGMCILTEEQIKQYTQLRSQEVAGIDPDMRVEAYFSTPFVVGYEIFARTRFDEANLLDVSFAKQCLEEITRQADEHGIIEHAETITYSLPKVTRTVGHFAVVSAKISTGTMRTKNGEEHTLKTRQAGVIDLDAYPEQVDALRSLADEPIDIAQSYADKRAKVLHFLLDESGSESIYPIIESLYLTRK